MSQVTTATGETVEVYTEEYLKEFFGNTNTDARPAQVKLLKAYGHAVPAILKMSADEKVQHVLEGQAALGASAKAAPKAAAKTAAPGAAKAAPAAAKPAATAAKPAGAMAAKPAVASTCQTTSPTPSALAG